MCLIGAKQSHVSQNFLRFSILPGILGGSVLTCITVLWPVVAMLADSSQLTVFDTAQVGKVFATSQRKPLVPDEEARGTSSHG